MTNDLLTTDEAAALKGVSRRTIQRLITLGELPATETIHGWRVQRADVEAAPKRGVGWVKGRPRKAPPNAAGCVGSASAPAAPASPAPPPATP